MYSYVSLFLKLRKFWSISKEILTWSPCAQVAWVGIPSPSPNPPEYWQNDIKFIPQIDPLWVLLEYMQELKDRLPSACIELSIVMTFWRGDEVLWWGGSFFQIKYLANMNGMVELSEMWERLTTLLMWPWPVRMVIRWMLIRWSWLGRYSLVVFIFYEHYHHQNEYSFWTVAKFPLSQVCVNRLPIGVDDLLNIGLNKFFAHQHRIEQIFCPSGFFWKLVSPEPGTLGYEQ